MRGKKLCLWRERKKRVCRIGGKWHASDTKLKISDWSQFKICSLRNSDHCGWYSRVLERGSRGPSTVTLIALLYVAICGGEELTIIVRVKLFPVTIIKFSATVLKQRSRNFRSLVPLPPRGRSIGRPIGVLESQKKRVVFCEATVTLFRNTVYCRILVRDILLNAAGLLWYPQHIRTLSLTTGFLIALK
jgi:hypothetical protein